VLRRDVAAVKQQVRRGDIAWQLQRCDLTGATALHAALKPSPSATSESGSQVDRDIVDLIIDAVKSNGGASANDPDANGWTPLHLAAQCQSDDVTRALLMLPQVQCNVRNNDGSTPLHYYCHYATNPACKETLELFQAKGIDVNAMNHFGEAPLHKAVFNSQIRLIVMEWLLKNGANVDAQTKITNDKGGDTALHYAVHQQRGDIVLMLVLHGASPKMPNAKRKTPMQLARDAHLTDIIVLLIEARRLIKYLGDPKLNMAQYTAHFLQNKIFLKDLPELKDNDLEAIGVKRPTDRAKLLKAIPYLGEQLASRRGAALLPNASFALSDVSLTAELEPVPSVEPSAAAPLADKKLSDSVVKQGAKALPNFNSQTTPEIDDPMLTLRKELNSVARGTARELKPKDVEYTEELGSGTSGTVFKGLVKLGSPDDAATPAAIKILKSSTAPNEMREFKAELTMLLALQHPNLIKFYGWQLRPAMLMVMELCENGSLYDLLNRKHLPIEWSHMLQWALETTLGVRALHTAKPKSIVHRDLKSLNLLIAKDYHVRVCDFGLSRHSTNSNMETLGKLRGTMAYCFPEHDHQLLTNRGFMFLRRRRGARAPRRRHRRRRRLARPAPWRRTIRPQCASSTRSRTRSW
jgi:ankyrin repeat protein